mgnify:CR=1 FL=1
MDLCFLLLTSQPSCLSLLYSKSHMSGNRERHNYNDESLDVRGRGLKAVQIRDKQNGGSEQYDKKIRKLQTRRSPRRPDILRQLPDVRTQSTSTNAWCFKPSVRTRKNLPPSRRVKVRKKGEEEEKSSRASERWNAWRFRVKLGEIERRGMLIKMRRRQDNTHPSETISTYKKKFHEPSCAACFPSRPPLLIPDA